MYVQINTQNSYGNQLLYRGHNASLYEDHYHKHQTRCIETEARKGELAFLAAQ